jgi:dTDP-4-amino-4,6-dideoxygalactose transaminase
MTGTGKALLTTSGTSALELAAILCDVGPGDEVILPSFTFSSTANAFALRGATLVFVDIQPDTMNIDPACVRAAITERTKAIVPMHYAGVCCDMDVINAMAKEHGVFVVEDAAQAVDATYRGKAAGALGDIGCYSFHETKNFSMGEGGAAIIGDPAWWSAPRSCAKRAPTAAVSSAGRWTSTRGSTWAPPSSPARSTPPTCSASWKTVKR